MENNVYVVTAYNSEYDVKGEVAMVTSDRSKAIAKSRELFCNFGVINLDDFDPDNYDAEADFDEENGNYYFSDDELTLITEVTETTIE